MRSGNLFCLVIVVLTILLVVMTSPLFQGANLQGQKSKFMLEGQTFDLDYLAYDFLEVSFSKAVWGERRQVDIKNRRLEVVPPAESYFANLPFSIRETLSPISNPQTPWIEPYLYRSMMPQSGVVHKWNKKITIGIDWPPYTYGEHYFDKKKAKEDYGFIPSPLSSLQFESYQIIENQVKSVLPHLAETTGLPVEFFSPSDPREQTGRHAKIRIVPILGTQQKSFFKVEYAGRNHGFFESRSFWQDEERLWGAVAFTPETSVQVEGYILPKPSGEIGIAVCKIWPIVGEKQLRRLVNECLVRSLGLTQLLKREEHSLLGEWNSLYSSIQADYFPNNLHVSGSDNVRFDENKKSLRLPVGFSEAVGDLPKLGVYEKALIKMLYCPEIKSGMDKNQALKKIYYSCN